LDDGNFGYIKANVATDSLFVPQGTGGGGFYAYGQAGVTVGMESTIEIFGPKDLDGVFAITMTFNGVRGAPLNNSYIYVQSGPGVAGGRGFSTSDPTLRGDIGFQDHALYGESINFCSNCNYSIGDDFLITVTAYLPFKAGDQSVSYAAQIDLFTQGGFIDGSHTAVFSIVVPDGFTYSSALKFASPVPEPETGAMLLVGLAMIALIGRRQTLI